ncbi:MAG TPA: hypothetical protein VI653_14325 [Steroidobacteraceae bacterium]
MGHAFLWEDSVMHDLGTWRGRDAIGLGINNCGQIVGGSDSPTSTEHAILWENGVVTDLNDILGGDGSIALGINSRGVIVGQVSTFAETQTTQNRGYVFVPVRH